MTAPQPAPAAADAREGDRVSVDAAAWAELEAAFQRAAEAGSDWEWKAEAVDHLLWPAYDNLQATARPLPTAAGAVDAATLAEWRELATDMLAEGWPADDLAHQVAAALRAACDALASATPAVPAPDSGALAAALDDVIMAAHTDGACGGGRSEGTDAAIDAVFALVYGAAPLPPAPAVHGVPVGVDRAAFERAVDAFAEAHYDAGKCAGSGDCGSPYYHPRACDAAYAALLALVPFADAPTDAQAVEA